MLQELFASIQFCNNLSKLDAALLYAKIAPVFPLWPNSKVPMISGSWEEYKTQDPEIIRQWWRNQPDANIAMVMGGTILASDLDMKKGDNGWASYQDIEPGEITAPMQITPSGGYHVIHGYVEGLINFTHKGSQGGIDMRTQGGYIIMTPSVVNGVAYKWHQGGEIKKLNGALIQQYTTWSQESSIDRSVDMPDPTPIQDMKPLDELPIRAKHLTFLEEGDVDESYSGDRSSALLAAAIALYNVGLSDEDVLGYLADAPGSIDCARDHGNARNPLIWLWRYNCLKARATYLETKRQQFSSAFDNLPEMSTVPIASEKERLLKVAEGIDATQDDQAIQVYREANKLSPLFSNRVLDILHNNAGFRKSDIEKAARQVAKASASAIRDASDVEPRQSGQNLVPDHPALLAPSAVVDSWETLVGRYVYISTEHKWLDRYTRETLSPEALNACQAHIMEKLNFSGEEGLKLRAHEALVARNDTLKVDVRSYWPGVRQDLIHIERLDAVNTWQPSSLEAIKGDITPWWTLMCHVFPEEASRERVMNWMGFILQYPEIKINYALLVGGAERIGKDTVFQPLIQGVGLKNSTNIKAEALDEKYEDHFVGVKLAVVQEIRQDGFKDAMAIENKLKVYLADPPSILELRRLGEKNTKQINLLQMLIFTNYRLDPVHLSSEGDRYLCEWSPAQKLTPEFYTKIYNWYEQEQGYEKVYEYLLSRDLSAFNAKSAAPVTEWRTEIRNVGKSDMEYQVEDIIDKVRQDNEHARTIRSAALQVGTVIDHTNAHLYHELLYITHQQILERLPTPISGKALSSIMDKLKVPRLSYTTDQRVSVPRIFEDVTFATVPGKDKFQNTKRVAVYVVENTGNLEKPTSEQLRLGLCPTYLINEYLALQAQ